jgi:hypothetical protein
MLYQAGGGALYRIALLAQTDGARGGSEARGGGRVVVCGACLNINTAIAAARRGTVVRRVSLHILLRRRTCRGGRSLRMVGIHLI